MDIENVSPTLAMNELILRRREQGQHVVPYGFGEANIPVLPELRTKLFEFGNEAPYGPVSGDDELVSAAAGWFTRRELPTAPSQIISAPGSKPLLYALVHVTEGPLYIASPSWVTYAAQGKLSGHEVVPVPTLPGQGGVPDPEKLALEVESRKFSGERFNGTVIVTLPDNPTGTLADDDTIVRLCEVAERNNLMVVSDEIYRDVVHDPHRTFLSPAEILPSNTVVTSGLSKNLGLGGWRIGFARFPTSVTGQQVAANVRNVASELWSSASYPIQKAAAWALQEPQPVVEHIRVASNLHRRVTNTVADIFREHDVDVPKLHGGFYLYPNFDVHRKHLNTKWGVRSSLDLSQKLLDEFGVATLPAVSFSDNRTWSLRVATSLTYGSDVSERTRTFEHAEPETLPWLRQHLDHTTRSLAELLKS